MKTCRAQAFKIFFFKPLRRKSIVIIKKSKIIAFPFIILQKLVYICGIQFLIILSQHNMPTKSFTGNYNGYNILLELVDDLVLNITVTGNGEKDYLRVDSIYVAQRPDLTNIITGALDIFTYISTHFVRVTFSNHLLTFPFDFQFTVKKTFNFTLYVPTLDQDDSLRKDVDLLNTTVSTHTSNIQVLNSQINPLVNTIKTHSADINTLSGKVTTLEGTVANHTSAITTTSNKVGTLETTVVVNTADIKNISAKISPLENAVIVNNTDIKTISGKVTTLEGTVTINTNDIKTVSGKVGALESNATTTAAGIKAILDRVAILESSVGDLKKTEVDSQKNLATLTQIVNGFDSKITTITTKNVQMEDKINYLANENTNRVNEIRLVNDHFPLLSETYVEQKLVFNYFDHFGLLIPSPSSRYRLKNNSGSSVNILNANTPMTPAYFLNKTEIKPNTSIKYNIILRQGKDTYIGFVKASPNSPPQDPSARKDSIYLNTNGNMLYQGNTVSLAPLAPNDLLTIIVNNHSSTGALRYEWLRNGSAYYESPIPTTDSVYFCVWQYSTGDNIDVYL